jgi:polar amino acid transport system permease protein
MRSNAFVDTFLDWGVIGDALPRMLSEGLRNTLLIAALSIVVGVLIGLVMAIMLLSRRWWVRLPGRIYVDTFRGLPVVLTVMLIGIGLPSAGFRPFGRDAFGYAVLAVGIISGAYLAEIFRSGIQSVESGQMLAARSLGLTYGQAMLLVIVPQGIRRILPALAGQFVKDIKESSLVYLLGLGVGQRELFFIAQEEIARSYNSSPLVAAGICYLSITVPLTHAVNWLDRRLRADRPAGAATGPDAPNLEDPLGPAVNPVPSSGGIK